MVKFASLRYAHEPGIIHLVSDPDLDEEDESGPFHGILSAGGGGGEAGEVMRWRVTGDVGDEDPDAFTAAKTLSAIAWRGDTVAVADERHHVRSFAYRPTWKADALLTRFTTPVTALLISKDGTHVLAASCDFNIKWVNKEDQSYTQFREHSAPVLGIALSPDEEFFASSSCDGSVRLWKLGAEESTASVANIQGLWPKSNDISSERSLGRLFFHPEGSQLCVPVKGALNVYDGAKAWALSRQLLLRDKDKNEVLSVTAVQQSGRIVAAATLSGLFTLWDWKSGSVLWSGRHSQALTTLTPTALIWHPDPVHADTLVFALADGRISSVSELPADSGDAEEDDALTAVDIGDEESRSSDIGALKRGLGFDADGSFVATKSQPPVVDLEPMPQVFAKAEPSWEPLEAHPSFVSASTPEGMQERYLKWNSVGVIRGQELASESGSLEVEFHDSAVHHAFDRENGVGFSLADLSADTVAFAAPALTPEDAGRLLVQYLSAWDLESREWTAEFARGDDPVALAVGSSFVAVATERRFVRVWTLGGLQKAVWSTSGRIVSLAAEGDRLAVVCEDALGLGGSEHRLTLSVHRLPESGLECRPLFAGLPLALSAPDADSAEATTLSWLGFTEKGNVVSADSAGWVRLLSPKTQSWVPILDLRAQSASLSHHYWVVGVRESPEPHVRAILCKGSRFPHFLPRPIVHKLDWALPLPSEEGASLASLGLRLASAVGEEEEAELRRAQRKALLLLFSAAVKEGRECRAADVARLMPDSAGVQTLIRYATRLRKAGLAERLGRIALAMDEEAEEEEPDKDDEEENEPLPQSTKQTEESSPTVKPSSRIRMKARGPAEPLGNVSAADSSLNASSLMGDSPMPPPPRAQGGNPFKRRAEVTDSQRSAYDVFDSQEPPKKRI